MLASSERMAIEQHCAALEPMLDNTREVLRGGRMVSNVELITELVNRVMIMPAAKASQAGMEARADDYLDALDDLPAWTVQAALRKWNRGESKPVDKVPHNFRWRPEPPILRALAKMELATVAGRLVELRQILGAEALIEFSEQHRGEMLGKLSTVLHSLTDNSPAPLPETVGAT
jgi:hypothetical protein